MGNSFTAQQLQDLQTLIPGLVDSVSRGQIPGFGSGQNDTYTPSEDCAPTFPLNIRYVIPSNIQRLVAARLSFHLAAFRSPVAGVSAVTTPGTNHYHVAASLAAGGANASGVLGFDVAVNLNTTGAGGGWFTGTEIAASPDVPTNATLALGPFVQAGHIHTFTPVLSYGVFEGAVAAGVTIKFDGVDQTTALGGPWSSDVIELDVRPYVTAVPGAYHTIALEPTGLGRIEAHLRLTFYSDGRLSV